jgi:threonyl-tRNA synthetase
MPKASQSQDIENIRHSFAHLVNIAVRRFYPKAQPAIGPAIENGFYQDFGNVNIPKEDLPKIENEMRAIAKRNLPFKKELWPASKAIAHFKKENQPYKIALAKDLVKAKKLTKLGIMRTGDVLVDLCRGGHIKNTKELPLDAFKLTRVAGAYWRGDSKNPMLTRVYGVAFKSKKELASHLARVEEAEKRDHRKLGRELGLFTFSELVGPGLPLFTPKGTIIRKTLSDFVENLERDSGYQQVWIPHITKPDLYRVSGHLEKFKEDLFYVKGRESKFVLKPMNCPHHTQIYKSQLRSWRDLPVRFFETTTVYRDEQGGEIGGLTRVRSITQDDGHAFLREEQIRDEIDVNLKIQRELVKALDLKEYWIRLSLRDEKNKKAYLGDDATWKRAQKEMESILKEQKISYTKAQGEAAFYGPKMDFMVKDSLGREWQFSTIQLDFNMPKRFDLKYITEQGVKKTPVMVHRAFMGSIERFMAMLIEHYAGAFPLWLAPEQVWIVPVSDKFVDYANKVKEQLQSTIPSSRVVIKSENETLGKKIREGETQKIPYLLVVGEKEKTKATVSPRKRGKGDLGPMKVDVFSKLLLKEIQKRSN